MEEAVDDLFALAADAAVGPPDKVDNVVTVPDAMVDVVCKFAVVACAT